MSSVRRIAGTAAVGVWVSAICVAQTASGPLSVAETKAYPVHALAFADQWIPELIHAIATCDKVQAQKIQEAASSFNRSTWIAHYEQLNRYRACFRLVGDVGAGTDLVLQTPGGRPKLGIGLLDQNYEACRVLAQPGPARAVPGRDMHWPVRLGPEPDAKHCQK